MDKRLIDTLKELEAEYNKRANVSNDKIDSELAEYTKTFREILEKKFGEDMEAMGLGVI